MHHYNGTADGLTRILALDAHPLGAFAVEYVHLNATAEAVMIDCYTVLVQKITRQRPTGRIVHNHGMFGAVSRQTNAMEIVSSRNLSHFQECLTDALRVSNPIVQPSAFKFINFHD